MVNKISQVKFEPMNEIHNQEVKVLNELLEAIEQDKDIESKFNVFLDDVKNHFDFEQNLMEKHNFFAKVPHKMEHDRIINELKEIKQSSFSNTELLEYFNQYFIPWLENHINTMDTVTAGYFDMVGVKI